jgi:hypothetical protein
MDRVQTFLPFPDFVRSAEVLDSPRLGKQRVETLQVLRALELPEYGWANHPAVRMWRGRTPALVLYGLTMVRAWKDRGHADSTDVLIGEFAPQVQDATQQDLDALGLLPAWLGDDRVHLSHRSALVRKDPAHYRPLLGDDVPDDLPYFWPDPDPGPVEGGPVTRHLWVVRPPTPGWRELFLVGGFVALGGQSGIARDVGAVDRSRLRELLAETTPRRRPGKDLRQLEAFVHEMAPGDLVAVPVEGGRSLVVGEVASGYRFAPGSDPGGTTASGDPWLPHVRRVDWRDTVPRAAVRPPATLQDPRTLFRVHLAEAPAGVRPPSVDLSDLARPSDLAARTG